MTGTGNHDDTGIRLRGRAVYRGARAGLYFLTTSGKQARLDKHDTESFHRRAGNPDLLTGLPHDVLSHIAGKLGRGNAVALAGTSRIARAAVAGRLSANKAALKNAWKALLRDLMPVLSIPRTAVLVRGQTVGTLTVTTPRSTTFDHPDPHAVLEGARLIDGHRYRVRAEVDLDDKHAIIAVARRSVHPLTHGPAELYTDRLFVHGSGGMVTRLFVNDPVVKEAAKDLGISTTLFRALGH